MASDPTIAPCPDCGFAERVIVPEDRPGVSHERSASQAAFQDTPSLGTGDALLIMTLLGAVLDLLTGLARLFARVFGYRPAAKKPVKMVIYCPKCGQWEPAPSSS